LIAILSAVLAADAVDRHVGFDQFQHVAVLNGFQATALDPLPNGPNVPLRPRARLPRVLVRERSHLRR
jgi:hypothetical protein